MGGAPVIDPGGGSLLREGCPDEREMIGDASGDEVVLCCKLPVVTLQCCETLSGDAIGDPGDGSLFRAGCPEAHTALAFISGLDEGGLCCER
jgi:hypothetical protein